MQRIMLMIITALLGTALSLSAAAQGRHDEKPHGSTKPSATSSEEPKGPGYGGRHDEKPHGTPKKASSKKKAEKAESSTATETSKTAK